MTETASSPIACNPLPPRQRKAGSVGVPVGLDVAIMDEGGALLPGGQTGEVVVRGASVMSGYDGDPMANQAAFAGDWFKTGDLGFFDDDGYLFLAGRTQEIINRGGEKIAPREVDEVLLEHPAVAEAVTFAVPHATLGEDVASAVVLRPDAAATPKDIRQFAIGRLADFKVPRQVLIVEEIPKGPTGKVQRIGLAAKLGLANRVVPPQTFVAPRTPLREDAGRNSGRRSSRSNRSVSMIISSRWAATCSLATAFSPTSCDITACRGRGLSLFRGADRCGDGAPSRDVDPAGQARRRASAIAAHPAKMAVPASIAQERLWKLQQALPDMPFFNVLYALRLTSACRRWRSWSEASTKSCGATKFCARRLLWSKVDTCRSLRRN